MLLANVGNVTHANSSRHGVEEIITLAGCTSGLLEVCLEGSLLAVLFKCQGTYETFCPAFLKM